jgi:hypothetical protein
MMIERVRLQRKFARKAKVDPKERLAHIAQMMVVFELIFVLLFSIISFSPRFHIHYVPMLSLSSSPLNFGQPTLSLAPTSHWPFLSSYCSHILFFGWKHRVVQSRTSLLLRLRLTS